MKFKAVLIGFLLCLIVGLASPVHAQQGAPSATLNWDDVTVPTPAALTYKVQRGTAQAGPFTQVGNPSASTFVDTTVVRGTLYFYRVISSCPATGAGCGTAAAPVNNDSAPSNVVSAMIPAATVTPGPPQNLTITVQ